MNQSNLFENKSEEAQSVKEYLRECLSKAKRDLDKSKLNTDDKFTFIEPFATSFFNSWFPEENCLYFLFSKNLSVTDIQFAELTSLIRKYIKYKKEFITNPDIQEIHNLQFSTSKEFKSDIVKLIYDFDGMDGRAKFLSDNYTLLVEKRVIVDSFYGSCAVYIPPNLSLDYAAVCAHSGYIHSCGKIVYIRNANKITDNEFTSKINHYIEKNRKDSEKRIRFVVYAHEDFKKGDIENNSMKHGLNDVKIHIEKSYMGKTKLSKVIEQIGKKYEDYLIIPNPNQLSPESSDIDSNNIDRTKTLWLHVDKGINADDLETVNPSLFHKEVSRYYICYEQHYRNGNPFLIFDENKPAWSGPVTMPHSLVSAMINVALPHSVNKEIKLHDPFAGTGTTVFEASKYKLIKATGSDKLSSLRNLVSDNLHFFKSDKKTLRLYRQALLYLGDGEEKADAKKVIQNELKRQVDDFDRHYSWLKDFVSKYFSRSNFESLQEFGEISLDSNELIEADPFEKLLFYLAARTFTKNQVYLSKFIKGGFNDEWTDLFKENLIKYSSELGKLEKFKEEVEKGKTDLSSKSIQPESDYEIYIGKWSNSLAINYLNSETFEDSMFLDRFEPGKDAKEIAADKYDIIVTDPPYGFNVDIDLMGLAELYTKVTESMLVALKDGGQLVISLPDRSYTGKQTPFFTHKEFVFQQILSTAEKLKYDLYSPVYSVPHPSYLFKPPYYWEAENSLRRAILHFRVDKTCAQPNNS